MVVGGDTVDINTIGDYTITYDVTDSAGNPAVQVTRLVRVRDTQSPYLLDVQVVDGWTVAVTFNKAMGVGVTDPLNYSVSGSGMGTLALNPESVALDTGNIYLLSWPVCGALSSSGDVARRRYRRYGDPSFRTPPAIPWTSAAM